MTSDFDIRLGQLALARGLLPLDDLLTCVGLVGHSRLDLGEVLLQRDLLDQQQLQELIDTLDETPQQQLDDILADGDTIILNSLRENRLRAETLDPPSGTTLRDLAISFAGPPAAPDSATQTTNQGDQGRAAPTQGSPTPAEDSARDDLPTTRLEALVQHDDPRPSHDGASLASSSATLYEQRYEILEKLGKGGMGLVELAHDRSLHRKVAIKRLRPDRLHQPEMALQISQEARITGNLEHPSIVPVYDYAIHPQLGPLYTMRVLRERDLAMILEEMERGEQTFSLSQLITILRQVLLALQFAHERGVIHRDLKPENILVGEYGEVYVIDWGVAKVDVDKLHLEPNTTTQIRGLVGTPAYMAPEQARALEDQIDNRTDVYAAGAILYELLTLKPLFDVEQVLALLFKVAHEEPLPPSKRAPERTIPAELEEICQRALAKEPRLRFQSAQEMASELELYLEGVKERERLEELADDAFRRAEIASKRYREERRELAALRRQLSDLRLRIPAWAPSQEKEELWRSEETYERGQIALEQEFGEIVRLFGTALSYMPSHADARRALADLYWSRFQLAEARGDRAAAAYFEALVRQYHDGHYDTLLEGYASIGIATDPGGADLILYSLEPQMHRLVEREFSAIGSSPQPKLVIPHGNYLLRIEHPEHVSLNLPMRLDRLQRLELKQPLYRREQIPGGFIVIPGGPFLSGTLNPDNLRENLTELPPFAIMRHPVTCAQYAEFLNEMAAQDPERAMKHAPHLDGMEGSYFPRDDQGHFSVPTRDKDGDSWDPMWPICMIDYHDACAYADWLSERLQHPLQLPNALQWEKAARGVDGRLYPWGNLFDASFCNMRESQRGKPMPVPVGSFPTDCSPYGVMDMAGNIAEWTSSRDDSGDSHLLLGASYNSVAPMCRLDFKMTSPPEFRFAHYGFRLIMPLHDAD